MESLDLHGTKHEDVRRKVIRLIEDNWDSGEVVEITTGHSKKMKRLVIEVVDEYSLPYKTSDMFDVNSPSIKVWM
jgi:hypothetical protein